MTIVLFLLVLIALIVVHEFGHFVVAKWSGMRVDEFGLGYPPRAWGFRIGETEYTINWLPFGGFVRIYGEDGDLQPVPKGGGVPTEENEQNRDRSRSFGSRPRVLQALVLLAGIAMNILFAWLLLSATIALGTPREIAASEIPTAKNPQLIVATVLPNSPAAQAGIKAGDAIVGAKQGIRVFDTVDATAFTVFVGTDEDQQPISIAIQRDNATSTVVARPVVGLIANDPSRGALGVGVATVGVVAVPWWRAPIEGASVTWALTEETAIGLWHFFAGLVTFSADLSQVTGPVGIAGAVGTASHHGLAALLSLVAVISINLALINLIPVPALDGGRLLFVIIEAIIRRPLPAIAARTVNTVGFALLILLMVVVTAHDVFKIFS